MLKQMSSYICELNETNLKFLRLLKAKTIWNKLNDKQIERER